MGKPDRKPGERTAEAAAREPPKFTLQRKCACGGGGASALTGECDDCDQKKLQRRAVALAPHDVPESVGEVLASSGAPLDPAARQDMESRFGHDFSEVRVHTDQRAAESARDVHALAYTVGTHVVFGAGQYAPTTAGGRHLLAHELTHTIQQHGGLHRQAVTEPTDATEIEADRTADRLAGDTVTGTYLVEDDAQPGAGQMRKTEFLDELQQSSCVAADAELARAGRSTEGCPFIEQAFARYRAMPAARVERSIRHYVDASGVTGARDYIPLITRRVSVGVARWAETGDLSGVPAELAGEAMGGGGVLGMLGSLAGAVAGGIGRLFFKRHGGGAATPAEATMVSSRLGGGAPLESGVRGRMEQAFGYDFSRVRIHSGSTAAGMSSSLGARAFTLGRDVGFGAGEYQPGTPAGDALLAHELAHVVQQSGGGAGATEAVEEDADVSAVDAVASLWGGAQRIARSALPRLRSGLRLSRCKSDREKEIERLGGVQLAFLEQRRKDEEDRLRKEAEEEAKKKGLPPPKDTPKVELSDITKKDKAEHGLKGKPTKEWDEADQPAWKKRAADAWTAVVASVKGTELEKIVAGVTFDFDPAAALKGGYYAAQSGNTLKVGMSWVRYAEMDPKNVWENIVHEMAGHKEYARTYSAEIMEAALSGFSAADRAKIVGDRTKFFEAYEYPETEIYASLWQRRYRVPPDGPARPSGGIHPDTNITNKLNVMNKALAPEVALAVLKELKRRVDANPEILQRDKDFYVAKVKEVFKIDL